MHSGTLWIAGVLAGQRRHNMVVRDARDENDAGEDADGPYDLGAHLILPAAFQRALPSWARLIGGAGADEIWVTLQPAAHLGRVEHETHFDVGGGEAVCDKIVAVAE